MIKAISKNRNIGLLEKWKGATPIIPLFHCSRLNGIWIFRNALLLFFFPAIILLSAFLNSCSTTEKLSDKSGVQLWGENCSRCHSVPPPTAYSDHQWETVGTHMKIRANLTQFEETKIIEFIKSSNEE